MNLLQQLFHLSGCPGTKYMSLPAGQSQASINIAIGMNKPTYKYICSTFLSFYAWTTIAVFSGTIMYKILTEILHSFNHSTSCRFLPQQSNQEAACNTDTVQVSSKRRRSCPTASLLPAFAPWLGGQPEPHHTSHFLRASLSFGVVEVVQDQVVPGRR